MIHTCFSLVFLLRLLSRLSLPLPYHCFQGLFSPLPSFFSLRSPNSLAHPMTSAATHGQDLPRSNLSSRLQAQGVFPWIRTGTYNASCPKMNLFLLSPSKKTSGPSPKPDTWVASWDPSLPHCPHPMGYMTTFQFCPLPSLFFPPWSRLHSWEEGMCFPNEI